jgi:predicted nucleotide-binding protein (sugar kinase/HSP70/actin superfamily)
LKKALLQAGYDDVPVVSASFSKQSANDQPGFVLNRPKLISLILSGLLVIDQFIRMYHATAVRERTKGDSLAVLKRHLGLARDSVGQWGVKKPGNVLKKAIADFNRIETVKGSYPKAGLVGEIYVKYNPFSNGNIVDRLMREGIQVTVPPLITFFLQSFVNVPYNYTHHIEDCSGLGRRSLALLQRLVDAKIRKSNKLMSHFKLDLEPIQSAYELAGKATKILNLSNQAGEGWLLPGEIVSMAESGIRNIISLQPFGCIANHVVAKGISKKLADLFPDLNFLALDMDAGNSDANIENRLAFFIHTTKAVGTQRLAANG